MLVECLVAAGPGKVKLVFVYMSKQWIKEVGKDMGSAMGSVMNSGEDRKKNKKE